MTLLESLLDAIVRLEGDALVMHVGEKPYVVTTSSSMNAFRGPLAWGQVELSSRVLTSEAVLSMVGQILPTDQRQALDDVGAVEHEVVPPAGVHDRFTIVAARGGEDVWLELRRHPVVVARPHEARPAAAEAPAAVAEAGTSSPVDSGAAVGLQEPPRHEEEDVPTIDETTIEERVPVLDEVGQHVPEHVEHISIPVDSVESNDHAEEDTVEVIDPEPQHALTDEDVDAMLADTAAELLTGGFDEREDGASPPDWVILDDGEAARELAAELAIVSEHETDEGDVESVDLSARLEEIPVSSAIEPSEAEVSGEAAAMEISEAAAESEPAPVSSVEPAAPAAEFEPAASPAETEEAPEPIGTEAIGIDMSVVDSVQSEPMHVEMPAMAQTHPPSAAAAFSAPAMPVPVPAPQAEDAAARETSEPSSIRETQVEHSAAMSKQRHEHAEVGQHAGVVVPIGRSAGRPERPAAGGRVDDQTLLQMLRVAAERAASTVYVVAQSRPMIRVDGEISPLEAEPVLSASDIDRLIAALAPRRPEAPGDAPLEWISEVPEVGRVRCVTFRDHRGPGLIFRMISAKSISADHLNLSPELRDLASQADGLIVVTGARSSGKSTLLHSFVDLINRTRSDHVITIETEIGFVHDSRRSFISQREFSNDPSAAGAAALSALKEDPDVLMIEDLHSPESIQAALEAAESGRLVFASITAQSSAAAIDAMVEMFPAGQRAGIRAALSRTLRAVVSQVLLRKTAGGRVTARELLLNSPAVAQSIRDGKSSEVAAALEAGGRHGMMSMNDSLVGLVRGGTVHSAEAYRRAPDRAALLACLARDGVDTSFAERLA